MPLKEHRAVMRALSGSDAMTAKKRSNWKLPVGGAYQQWAKEFRKSAEYDELKKGKNAPQIQKELKDLFAQLSPTKRQVAQEQWSAELGTAKTALPGKRPNPSTATNYEGRTIGGSYQLWLNDYKKESRYADMKAGKDAGQLAKALGQVWRDLPQEEKAPYEERSSEERREFAAAKAKRLRG